MSIKAYVHDKQAVFLNLILIFAGIINILLVVLRIDTSKAAVFIRVNKELGFAGFEKASPNSLYQFILIPLLIVFVQTFLSLRLHRLKRGLSVLVLRLGIVAVVFSIVVTDAILGVDL